MGKISRLISIVAFFLFGFSLANFTEAKYWIVCAAFLLLAASNIVYMNYIDKNFIDIKTAYSWIEEISSESNG